MIKKLRWSLSTGMIFCFSLTLWAAPPTGNYADIVDEMRRIEAESPDFAHVYSIGENDDGVPIYAIRISESPKTMDPKKIGHLMVSTHHGNEAKSPTFTMAFVTDVVNRYKNTDLWRNELTDVEWTIVPVLNISGYNRYQRREKGYDPNRDYPGPCISSSGGKLKSVRQLMNLMESRIFSGSVTVHGYVGTLTYPWGMNVSDTKTLDHNQFESITARAAAINNYRYGTSTDVVYSAEGAYEDYAYWKFGMWSLLLELRSGSDSDIKMTVPAIYKYYEQLDSSPSTSNQLTSECMRRKNYFDRLEKRK